MAIVQISQITNRLGLTENLPQLAGAELGWCTDTRRLFIGNGTLQAGAPVIGNTEILTEYSDILALSALYTYQGAAAGYIVQTGPTSGSPVTQSLQSWLDQWASVKNFGAVGDGVTDDTLAIQRAMYELYCREVNPQIRRALFFPAGRYLVTEAIVIPSYARLYGEGARSSVIVLDSTSPTSTLNECVARYGDSLQQSGVNIGNNGAIPPTNIEISQLGFESLDVVDVFIVEDANNCNFTNVSFQGPLTQADLDVNTDDTACIRIESTLSLITNNVSFTSCQFGGTTYAFATPNQCQGITVTLSNFDTLYQGVILGLGGVVNGGPVGFKIVGNSFDNIYAQGISFESGVSLCVSMYNIFLGVGNHFGAMTSPATTIVNIDEANNVSIGDMFERTAAFSTTYARVNLNDKASIAFENAEYIKQGTYVRETGQYFFIEDNFTEAMFTIDAADVRAFQVNYTVVRDTKTKTGVFTVVASTDGSGGDLSTNDTNVLNIDPGVTLTASESGSVVTVGYISTSTGLTGYMHYSVTHLA
jgi:hypothetical protein